MDGDGLVDRKDLRNWGRVAAAQAKALAAEDAGWGVKGKFAPEKTVAEVRGRQATFYVSLARSFSLSGCAPPASFFDEFSLRCRAQELQISRRVRVLHNSPSCLLHFLCIILGRGRGAV